MEKDYQKKYKHLRRYMASLIYENCALYVEANEIQQKTLQLNAECKELSKRLRNIEARESNRRIKTTAMQKRVLSNVQLKKKRKISKKTQEHDLVKLQHNICGQVVFPITLKEFEIHSLGEIISDKLTYHTEDVIYPVGFCSTHVYGSVMNPQMKCIYTCKISDGGDYPLFEISSDGEDGACFVGSTPDECHSQLIEVINSKFKRPFLSENIKCGADFFGLSHPSVHDLILSLPGVSRCIKYSVQNFEKRHNILENNAELKQSVDATVYYNALIKAIGNSSKK